MQQTEETTSVTNLFVNNTFKGDSRSPESVLLELVKTPGKQKNSYLFDLASAYNVDDDIVIKQFAKLGALLYTETDVTDREAPLYFVLPPFLANRAVFDNTFRKVLTDILRLNFKYQFHLFDMPPTSMASALSNSDWYNKIIDNPVDKYTWWILEWNIVPKAFIPKDGEKYIDNLMLKENVLYYIFSNIMSTYTSNPLLNLQKFTPSKATTKEINDIKLRPLLTGAGESIKVLYVEPEPVSKNVLNILRHVKDMAAGTTSFAPMDPNSAEIRRNQRCSLGQCNETGKHAKGLLFKKSDQPKTKQQQAMQTTIDCNNKTVYTRGKLEELAGQAKIDYGTQTSNAELCEKIKAALRNKRG